MYRVPLAQLQAAHPELGEPPANSVDDLQAEPYATFARWPDGTVQWADTYSDVPAYFAPLSILLEAGWEWLGDWLVRQVT